MKKLFFTAILTLATITMVNAQGAFKFGATGGLLNINTDINLSLGGIVNLANIDAINKTGFYIGAIGDLEVSDKLHIQPEVTYGKAGDLSFVYVPIMLKYYVAQGLNIQGGPQFNFSSELGDIKKTLNDLNQNGISDTLKTMGVELGFGAGYDINENFAVQARYAFELTNRYDGPGNSSVDIKNATLNVGLVYFF